MRKKLIAGITGALVLVVAPSSAYAAPVAVWKMDEAPDAVTMMDTAPIGGANYGTIDGVITGVEGLLPDGGSAYQFGGTASSVSVPDDDSLDPGASDITLTATVNIQRGEMLDDSYEVVRKGLSSTKGGHWKMEIKRSPVDATVGKLLCVFKGTDESGTRVVVQKMANRDVVTGTPHTLICVKTPTSVQAVVDGKVFTKAKAAGSIANSQPVILGSKITGDDVLQGVLDQVTVDIG